MILSGLDAIWETAYGYPPDGARDVPAFKRFLRSHQVPSEVFFSAYPEETVLNMTNDLNVCACLRRRHRRPAADHAAAAVTWRASRRRDSRKARSPTSRVSSPADTATCRTPRTCSCSFTMPSRRSDGWPRSVPPSRRRSRGRTTATGEKLKPAVALNVAFTADGLAGARAAAGRAVHVPRRVSGRHRRRRTLENSRRHRRERSRGVGARRKRTAADPRRPHRSRRCRRRSSRTPAARNARCWRDTAGGVVELPGSMQSGYRPDGDNEPFGFHDGIAQPAIAGISGEGVPTGEFILGYTNHFDLMPPTPVGAGGTRCRCAAAFAGQPVPRVAEAAGSRPQRLVRRLPEAAAGRRGLLAVHETRNRSHHRNRRCRPHDLAGVAIASDGGRAVRR